MERVKIEEITTRDSRYELSLGLRNGLLREPLGLNLFTEDLSDEVNQYHFVALQEQNVVGVVVMIKDAEVGKLRQMAVETSQQGKGIGALLVLALEKKAMKIGLKKVKLHARYHAVGFYEKLGYRKTEKAPFKEVGMEHYEMVKGLGWSIFAHPYF